MSDKVKKAIIGTLGDIIAIVEVKKSVRSVRVCRETDNGTPVNSFGYRVTAAKKIINSRAADEAQEFCTAKELPCGTFLLIF